jgi:hypothetical protein
MVSPVRLRMPPTTERYFSVLVAVASASAGGKFCFLVGMRGMRRQSVQERELAKIAVLRAR